jgi:hypothetical protein
MIWKMSKKAKQAHKKPAHKAQHKAAPKKKEGWFSKHFSEH